MGLQDLSTCGADRQVTKKEGCVMLHPGIYRHPETAEPIRVRLNELRTHTYAETWEINARTGRYRWKFRFYTSQNLLAALRPEHRLPLDEARTISIEAGQCLACAAILRDPKSQAEGIGPVCMRTYGYLYDEQVALLGIESVA